ncbi:hypothetical protein UCRNP2_7882 [Neofusicoccum parvum UCRNP2]|uniref:Uncharacterized protein n=1 Tax=Botryosphaeria parva (strain UCR-NP2) TaxID=1287680 RepID=R1ED56_BOTPV|nr:hypothetical protein UCRNP2_7882 [Neofusicoccum parvum UCRNP2]
MRQSPPSMVLNLPAHTQKQLANMASSPAPMPSPDATPVDQYRLTMAQRYRQQIQQIMNADLLAQDPDAIVPAPITTTTQITTQILTSEFEVDEDDDELLPPYAEEEEGNASDCTITVQEIDSPDTPSDDHMVGPNGEPRFFTHFSSGASSPGDRPHSATSEPTAILRVEFEPKPLSRARPLPGTAKKGGVNVTEKACRDHHSFLRPRSRSNSSGTNQRPRLSPRNSKVRKQLAAIFSSKAHDGHSNAAKPTIIRSSAFV